MIDLLGKTIGLNGLNFYAGFDTIFIIIEYSMIRSKRTVWKLFFLPLMAVLFSTVMSGCSDDDDELQQSQYGYVQFKLYKSASYVEPETGGETSAQLSRADVDKLGDATKIAIELQFEGTSITQTVVLTAYNEANADYGLSSDKLEG